MAKSKGKGGMSVPNRHIYTRASYLYQAATHLATHAARLEVGKLAKANTGPDQDSHQRQPQPPTEVEMKTAMNISRRALSDMKAVSLKVQMRHTTALKRTMCKFCDTLLIEGQTCHTAIENPSKGGEKPWADVLAISCKTCERVKRYPVGAPRQKRRPMRAEPQSTNG